MIRSLLFAVLCLFGSPTLGFGCECIGFERPCERMGSEAIFAGRVLETQPVRHPVEKDTWTYYPGATSRSSAKVVHVNLGEVKEIELPIGEVAQERTVHFVATGLDGKPLKAIYIQLEDLRHPGDAASYVNVDLDKNGNGTMKIFAGYPYHLHGSHWVSYQNDWCAKPVVIPAGTEAVDVRFDMDHKADNCDIYDIDHLKR